MSDFENASIDPGIEPEGEALGAGEFQEEAQDAGLGAEQDDEAPASDDVLSAEDAGMTG